MIRFLIVHLPFFYLHYNLLIVRLSVFTESESCRWVLIVHLIHLCFFTLLLQRNNLNHKDYDERNQDFRESGVRKDKDGE